MLIICMNVLVKWPLTNNFKMMKTMAISSYQYITTGNEHQSKTYKQVKVDKLYT